METAGRFYNSTCQICRLSRFYIPLNRELDAVWVGCLPLTKLYFAIWVECVPPKWQEYCSSGGDTLAYSRTADGRRNAPCVQSHCRRPPECSLRTATLPTAAGMLLAYNRTADGRRNGPCVQSHCRQPPECSLRTIALPTAAGMAHIRADKPHPRLQTTSAPTNHIRSPTTHDPWQQKSGQQPVPGACPTDYSSFFIVSMPFSVIRVPQRPLPMTISPSDSIWLSI